MTDHKALIERLRARAARFRESAKMWRAYNSLETQKAPADETADALSTAAEALEGAERRVKAAEAEATVLHVALAEARDVVEFVATSPYRGSRETVTPESAWPAYLRLHDIYMGLCERAQHWLAAQGVSDDK